MDREKVIKGIKCSLVSCEDNCKKCPYHELFVNNEHCGTQLKKDALALLKEQQDEIKTLKALLDEA